VAGIAVVAGIAAVAGIVVEAVVETALQTAVEVQTVVVIWVAPKIVVVAEFCRCFVDQEFAGIASTFGQQIVGYWQIVAVVP